LPGQEGARHVRTGGRDHRIAGGIGAVTAASFAADGDIVIGLDLTSGFDVTDRADCDAAAADVVAAHGRVDVLCNIAGIGAVGDVVEPPRRTGNGSSL
jgi:NAD(P)-dependent dehydrogenase (short-subunit alcohol dehydrogenase family)